MRYGLLGGALRVGVLAFLSLNACRPGDTGADGATDAALDSALADRPTPAEDSALDASDAGTIANHCIRDASESLPPNAPHVDCVGGITCEAGSITVSLIAPVYYCSMEDLLADNRGGFAEVCARDGYHLRCPSGQCTTSRYAASCRPTFLLNRPSVRDDVLLTFCQGAERAAGAPCGLDEDCRPAVDRPDYALRCDRDAGACVQAPRPERPATFGALCMGGLGDCARTEASCGSRRRTATCTLDEDCPSGFDCAVVDTRACSGRCVPRGARDPEALIPCAVFGAADAGVDASSDGG